MFEKDDDYYKARKESKDRITKVIKVWNGKEEAIHDGGFEKGAEFGYNKVNEWHDLIADPNDLPKEEHKSPSECKNYYVVWFGKNNFSGAKFINGKFCDGDFVYYPDEIVKWKEIVLPKESE